MRTLKTLTLLAALVLGITTQAGAVLFNITFNDGNTNVGSGQIDVELANSIYYAASGSLTVTGGKAIGNWNLYTASGYTSYPSYLTSPAGQFIYNNAVYPSGYNPQYPTANPLLDDYGLFFTQNNGNELNLWGNADGTYNLGAYIGGSLILNVTIAIGDTTITPNPAPASKLVFTTTAVSVTAGTASGTITVQRQDPSGNPNTTDANCRVTLASNSSGTVTFSPASPLTIAYGSSSASFTYTDTKAGSPTITAASTSPTTITSATQQETVTKATPSISGVTASQGISYGTASVTLSGTVSAPGSVYPANGETVSVTINGSSQNATISGGAGGFSINFPTATIPYFAGAYTITYAYASDGNLNAANNTSTALTVNKAALGVTASAQSKTYGQTVTFGSGSTLFTSSGLRNSETIGSVTLACSGGAGTAAVSASPYTITPSAATGGTFNAANYTITYNTGNLTVNKATPTVTVTVGSYTYTGSAQGPSAFTTSPSGDTGTPTWQYVGVSGTTYGPSANPPTLAGSYTAQVTALTSDANFNSASSSATPFTIGRATPTVTVTVGSYTCNGSAQGPTAVTTASSGAVTWSYTGTANGGGAYTASATPPTLAGSYTATATVAQDNNYTSASSSATPFTIGRATPTVTVTVGSYTYNGSAQGPTAVTTASSGAVTWSYTGTANGGGTYTASATPPTLAGSYTATATVAQDNNYNSASSTATAFAIGKASSTIVSLPTAGTITYGDTLASSTLTGGLGTPPSGTFAFTTPGTAPGAGTASQSVTYTPPDTANYNTAVGSVNVTVYPKLTVTMTLTNFVGTSGQVAVVFVAKDAEGVEVGRDEVELAAPGGPVVTYAMGVPANTATLSAKPRFFLRRKVHVSISGNTMAYTFPDIFIGGDVNNDNQVDGTDYAWLRACWGQTGPLAPNDINGDGLYDARDFPDLNGDGTIDALDYGILKDGWYQAGDAE